MRALIMIAGAGLAISACGKDQTADNTINMDANTAVEEIASNDITAIDAATGEDANMAADVDFTVNEDENIEDGNASENETGNAQ